MLQKSVRMCVGRYYEDMHTYISYQGVSKGISNRTTGKGGQGSPSQSTYTPTPNCHWHTLAQSAPPDSGLVSLVGGVSGGGC